MPILVGGRRYRLGRRFLRRAVALGAILTVAAFASAARQAITAQRRIEEVRRELEAQRRHNADLERAIAEATSPRAIERRARATMGLVRPGERVFEPAVPVAPDDPFRVPRRTGSAADEGG